MKKCNAPRPVNSPSKPLQPSQTLGGAFSLTGSMQGRPEGAEGKPCDRTKGQGIALPESLEKCYPWRPPTVNPSASKYNGGSFDKRPFAIGIDFLKVNLLGALPFTADEAEWTEGDFKFEHKGTGSKHFEAIFALFYKNVHMGNAEIFPRSTVLDKHAVLFKLENQLFYDGTDIREFFEKMRKELGLQLNNITRLDVFLDSYGFDNGITLNHLDFLIDEGKVISNTRVKDKAKHGFKQGGRFITTGFSWGSRKSAKYLRIYNKTIELEGSGKQYIKKFHQLNGLGDRDVYRFEYELKSEYFRNLAGHQFEDIFSTKGIMSILNHARKGHFSFVVEDGQQRNDRKEELELINWKEKEKTLAEPVFDYCNIKRVPQEYSKKGVQLVIRGLLKEYIHGRQYLIALKNAYQLLNKYSLGEWFKKKEEDYLKEFLKKRSYLYEFDRAVYENDKAHCARDWPI